MAPSPPPRVSIVVRSYNRLPILAELLAALLEQDHDSFEVIVVEQSTHRDPADVARIAALADPRLRVLRYPPLGGPRARNTGVRAARGDIIVLIDDDDLPHGRDWLRRHEANYADPKCLAVTGRLLDREGKPVQPYRNLDRARRNVLTFNVLKWQRCYIYTDRRARVESMMGSNVSLRRSVIDRFGLWDECTPIEDEPSIAYRINAGKQPDEYMTFDPDTNILRGLDVPGGMDKRTLTPRAYARKVFAFQHHIVAYYFPIRFALLYPLYYLFSAYLVADWMTSDSRRYPRRIQLAGALAGFYLMMPLLWMGWLGAAVVRRLRHGPLPRVSSPPTVLGETAGPPVLARTQAPKAARSPG